MIGRIRQNCRGKLSEVAVFAALLLCGLVNAQIKLERMPGGEVTSIPCFERNQTYYVSITGFCEAEGFASKWDPASEKLTCTSGKGKAVFSPDNPFYFINDSLFQAPHAPVRHDESLYLPVKVLVACFGGLEKESIEWDPQDSSITISPVKGDQLNVQTKAAKPAETAGNALDSAHEAVNAGQIIKTFVIDPGHGGKDPGAIGPDGTSEKDIVLGIGLKLRDLIKKKSACRSS
jgi:N-acetylmuramoyl-L-alanine amidase